MTMDNGIVIYRYVATNEGAGVSDIEVIVDDYGSITISQGENDLVILLVPEFFEIDRAIRRYMINGEGIEVSIG